MSVVGCWLVVAVVCCVLFDVRCLSLSAGVCRLLCVVVVCWLLVAVVCCCAVCCALLVDCCVSVGVCC